MSDRIPKVNQLLKEEVSKILLEELEHSVSSLITITSVETTRDLRSATLWVSLFADDKEKEKILKDLEKITPQIQRAINKKLFMKNVPKISFKEDRSILYSEYIDKLIEKSRNENQK